jgi:two-component system CheB/CheR fusion protein
VDLHKIIDRITDDLEIIITERKAQITASGLPEVHAIPQQMHQVFQNLISNALKFNQSPKPVISITAQQVSPADAQHLKIKPERFYCIRVKDNGIGFDEKHKDRIFDPFEQLNGKTYEGSGIGLAICKKVVENHDGYLLANSTLHKGAEFRVLLPV